MSSLSLTRLPSHATETSNETVASPRPRHPQAAAAAVGSQPISSRSVYTNHKLSHMHVTVYWYMSHCYVRCIFMIFQAHKIELEALYAELEKQARMAGAGDDDGATVAAASASAAAKPSSSASSSSASASASASSSAQDGSGPARKRRRSAATATASSAAVGVTFEDDEDVSSFFSYSCMTEYSTYFYVYYYYFICDSRMTCSQAAPHLLEVLLTRPQSRSRLQLRLLPPLPLPPLLLQRGRRWRQLPPMLPRQHWRR